MAFFSESKCMKNPATKPALMMATKRAIPMVKAALSSDGGRTFGSPMRIDEGNPLGRAHVQLIGPGRGVVTWLEAKGNEAVWQVRQFSADSPGRTAVQAVGTTVRTRDGGFARTALIGSDLYIAYAEPGAGSGEPPQVRVTRQRLSR